MSKEFNHNVIAIVYDFDGTLTPQPMQEYTILPQIGIRDGNKFWKQVNEEAVRTNGEAIVAYMRLMLEKSKAKRFPITAEILKDGVNANRLAEDYIFENKQVNKNTTLNITLKQGGGAAIRIY